jgi:hypothetical protein
MDRPGSVCEAKEDKKGLMDTFGRVDRRYGRRVNAVVPKHRRRGEITESSGRAGVMGFPGLRMTSITAT